MRHPRNSRTALSQRVSLDRSEIIILDVSNVSYTFFIIINTIYILQSTTPSPPPTTDVELNVDWTYAAGVTTVKMIISNLKISQWLALGFSLDDQMVLNLLIVYRIIYLVLIRERIMYLFVNI